MGCSFFIFSCAIFNRSHQTDDNRFSAYGLGTGTTHHCYGHSAERKWGGNIIAYNSMIKSVIGYPTTLYHKWTKLYQDSTIGAAKPVDNSLYDK